MMTLRSVSFATVLALLVALPAFTSSANVQSSEAFQVTVTDASEPVLVGLGGTLTFTYNATTMKFELTIPLEPRGEWFAAGFVEFYTHPGGWEVVGRNFFACQFDGVGHFTLDLGNSYVSGTF